MSVKKTFQQKLLDAKDMPRVQVITDARSIKTYGGDRMLLMPPLAYDEVMRKIPKGKLCTSTGIRAHFAKAQGADFTCPLTAGIFISLCAQASEERGTDPTPFWRTLKKDGELNEKYPGGVQRQKELLEQEGHTVLNRGKRFFVKDYEQALHPLT